MFHVHVAIFYPLPFHAVYIYEFIKPHKNQQNILGVDENCCKGKRGEKILLIRFFLLVKIYSLVKEISNLIDSKWCCTISKIKLMKIVWLEMEKGDGGLKMDVEKENDYECTKHRENCWSNHATKILITAVHSPHLIIKCFSSVFPLLWL